MRCPPAKTNFTEDQGTIQICHSIQSSVIYLAGVQHDERDPWKKQRVQAAVVVGREHHVMVPALLLEQRHLQKLVLVRQRGKRRRKGAWAEEARKAGLKLAAPLHTRI